VDREDDTLATGYGAVNDIGNLRPFARTARLHQKASLLRSQAST